MGYSSWVSLRELQEDALEVQMNRAMRICVSTTFLGVSLATLPAAAGLPVPCSDAPCGINLVGLRDGVADPRGEFTVVVRDPACNPVQGLTVVLSFMRCPDIRICSVQGAGVSASCSDRSVQAVSGQNGQVKLRIVGGAKNATGAVPGYQGRPPCQGGQGCCDLYADGILLAYMAVGAYDENSAGGVNPVDLAVWLTDAFSGSYFARSDFDFSGSLNPGDLSLELGASLTGNSSASCASFCQ